MATIRNLDAVYNNRKSFYGKAKVKQDGDTITLVSYGMDILGQQLGI